MKVEILTQQGSYLSYEVKELNVCSFEGKISDTLIVAESDKQLLHIQDLKEVHITNFKVITNEAQLKLM